MSYPPLSYPLTISTKSLFHPPPTGAALAEPSLACELRWSRARPFTGGRLLLSCAGCCWLRLESAKELGYAEARLATDLALSLTEPGWREAQWGTHEMVLKRNREKPNIQYQQKI